MPEFGTAHPARDYPSAPSVDLKHDRGNCAVGDVRDRWKKSESGRGHYLNREGGTHHSVSVKIWRKASKKEEKSFPFHKDVQLVIVFSVCEDLNKENWSVSKKHLKKKKGTGW